MKLYRRLMIAVAVWTMVVSSFNIAQAAVTINFDAINAHGVSGGVGGVTLSNYLAGFGLSITGVTPGTQVVVLDERDIYPGLEPVVAPSPFNVLAQSGSNSAVSYKLTSSSLLDSISFTRPGILAGQTGIALPQWSAEILNSQSQVIGSVGESAHSIFSDIPAKTFTLNGPGITAIEFDANAFNFAALSSMPIDNVVLTAAVPEPSSIVLFGVGAALTFLTGAWRRRTGAASKPRTPLAR